MRIKELDKYDENLTIGELKKQLIDSADKEKLKKDTEFQTVKDKYKNSYLKRKEENFFWGESLEVFYIGEIIERVFNEDYSPLYRPKGFIISFSKRNFNLREIGTDHFSAKQLEEMTIIKEDEYRYYRDIYSELEMELSKLLES